MASGTKCGKCGYSNAPDALNCNLCGEILRKEILSPPSPAKKGDTGDPVAPLTKTETDPLKFRARQAPPDGTKQREIETLLAPGVMHQEGAGPLNWFLVCFPLDPVPLNPERKTVIGRSGECDLILPVGVVSRQHAEIFFETGGTFRVRDLNSFNGTFVNEEKVQERDLKDGDLIRIGPYTIQVKCIIGDLEEVAAAFAPKDKTEMFQASDLVDADYSFSGKIGAVKIDEVFQLVDFNKKTGTLEVEAGQKKGVFRFLDGQLVFAEFNRTNGETAVIRVLNLESGNFTFKGGLPGLERNVFESTSKILLNAMRRKDEFGR